MDVGKIAASRARARSEVVKDAGLELTGRNTKSGQEYFGIHLDHLEASVFELLMDGCSQKMAAQKLQIHRSHVAKMMLEGQPVARAMHRANAELHRRLQEQRVVMLGAAMGYMTDLVNDAEADPELRLKAASELLDRFGAPRVTHTKGTVTHTGNVAVTPIPLDTLQQQIAQLQTARQQVIEVLPEEVESD